MCCIRGRGRSIHSPSGSLGGLPGVRGCSIDRIGESIVRAEVVITPLLFHAMRHVRCKEMLCIPAARCKRGTARAEFPGHPSHEIVINQEKHAILSPYELFFAASRPWPIRSRMLSRSYDWSAPCVPFIIGYLRTLSSLSLVTTTFEAAIGIGTDWPLLFSRTTTEVVSGSQRLTVKRRTSVNVKAVLQAVDRGDLALTALVCSTHDHDLVLALFSMSGRSQNSRVRTSFRTGMLLVSADVPAK